MKKYSKGKYLNSKVNFKVKLLATRTLTSPHLQWGKEMVFESTTKRSESRTHNCRTKFRAPIAKRWKQPRVYQRVNWQIKCGPYTWKFQKIIQHLKRRFWLMPQYQWLGISERCQSQKDKYTTAFIWGVPRIIRFFKTESRFKKSPRKMARGNVKLVFTGYRVSAGERRKSSRKRMVVTLAQQCERI